MSQRLLALPIAFLCGVMVSIPSVAPAAEPAAVTDKPALPSSAAPSVNLRLSYESRVIGNDGVTRDSYYSDLMYRRPGMVWIERELPAALQESEEHEHEHQPRHNSPHAGHAHDEAQGAPLLVQRDEKIGKVTVQAILQNLHRVIDVELAHYANVGYGGSWETAYWLVDPAALQQMERVGPVHDGVQRYRLDKGERTILIDWDSAAQYARRIEQGDSHGISTQRLTVTRLPEPKTLPWQQLEGYERGDYSDLLD